ncbi:unnamed protein product [Mytilus coruscus]|uniref:HTH CENPB-type domain-containing protein n=1 Tax=Mytilus coruscus TaxID=42192 RepID=A0A6J8AKB4_MYTCO|nr:unnamed protein product [Mytilus coruscus]
MGKIRQSFTVKEKLKVVAYAEAHGNRAAGREFTIDEKNVRNWRKLKERLQKMPKTKKANRGSAPHFPDLEKALMPWVTDRRQQGFALSTTELRLKAIHLSKSLPDLKNFRGSIDWCYGFLRRHDLSIHRRTHISQKLPADYEDKLLEFQKYIIKVRKQNNYLLSQIGNADQTPLTFDLPADTTIDHKGTSTVNIRTTGNEKNRFTVMLACTADGGKLPPYVVFKRKTMPKIPFPKGLIVQVHQNGWFDDRITKDWLTRVWGRRPGAGLSRSLLVLDAFRCHKSEEVKTLLKDEHKSDLAIIPCGMTSILQPLDVSINKPMKVALRQKWNAWISGDDHSFTNTGRMRKPELPVICSWIVEAWEELDPQIICRSFKKCTISNALDGSEDDMVWEEHVKASIPPTEDEGEEDEELEVDRDIYYYDEDEDDDMPLAALRDIFAIFREEKRRII